MEERVRNAPKLKIAREIIEWNHLDDLRWILHNSLKWYLGDSKQQNTVDCLLRSMRSQPWQVEMRAEMEAFNTGQLTGSIANPDEWTLKPLVAFAMRSARRDLVEMLLSSPVARGAKPLTAVHLLLLIDHFVVFEPLADMILSSVRRFESAEVRAMLVPLLRPYTLPYLHKVEPYVIKYLGVSELEIFVQYGLATYAVEGEAMLVEMISKACFVELSGAECAAIRRCIADHPEMVGAEVIRVARSNNRMGHICWYWQLFAPQEKRALLSRVPYSMKHTVSAAVCEYKFWGYGDYYQRDKLEVLPTLPEDVAYRCLRMIKYQDPLSSPIWKEPSPLLDRLLRGICWGGIKGDVRAVWFKSLFPKK
jgi:hypothetical protein